MVIEPTRGLAHVSGVGGLRALLTGQLGGILSGILGDFVGDLILGRIVIRASSVVAPFEDDVEWAGTRARVDVREGDAADGRSDLHRLCAVRGAVRGGRAGAGRRSSRTARPIRPCSAKGIAWRHHAPPHFARGSLAVGTLIGYVSGVFRSPVNSG